MFRWGIDCTCGKGRWPNTDLADDCGLVASLAREALRKAEGLE